jgi:methylase of polypeptide subunit release factors
LNSIVFNNIKYSISKKDEFDLDWLPGVFKPNLTTELLIKAVSSKIMSTSKVLELGCGTGIVGLALNAEGIISQPIYASDLSEAATNCSKSNFSKYGCDAEVRKGSLFDPWAEYKFDVVVDDISGISEEVAKISPWFQGVPCQTGKNGTNLTIEIIEKASKYLTENGFLFFPVLSLSDSKSILQVARENFKNIERVAHKEWPLPDELKSHIDTLKILRDEGSIDLNEKFGMFICYTDVYCVSDPF